jgi:hypothetical protein
MRANARISRLKAEGRFCLRKSWKAEGKNFGPSARLFLPSAFSLQPSVYSSIKKTA